MNLREKIKFIRVTTTQDVDGELVNSESTYYEPQGAQVTELQPSVDVIAQQQNLTTIIEVKLRYNPEVSIINGDKIEWRGFRFNALSPKVDPLRRWVTIKAFSEIETTDREEGDTPPSGDESNTLQATLQFAI